MSKFQARLIFKYGVIYREVMHTPWIDWCQMMANYNDKELITTPLNQMLRLISDSAPSVIHECPYTVKTR